MAALAAFLLICHGWTSFSLILLEVSCVKLFEVVPSELFSVLASPNRELYADALDVLYEAYGDSLKIPESEYYRVLRNRLEQQLNQTSFEGEDIDEEERQDASGKTRFLIRKLGSRGWFEKERGRDFNSFEEYLTIPSYSARILEMFHQLRDNQPMRGFSYVYGTYSTLTMANQGDSYEKMMAVYSAYDNTRALIKMLQTVYGSIKSYFQKQIDMSDVNQVLAAHFDDFGQRVVEAYIRPLKVKDSVPRYRFLIQSVLNEWLEDQDVLMAMASAALQDQRRDTLENCRYDLVGKILWVKDRYERIESEYLDEIDQQVRRYTRATTQKLENLTNRDQSTRGNLNYLLSRLARNKRADALVEKIQPVFQIFEQSYLSEKSLWLRKRPVRKPLAETLSVEKETLSDSAMDMAKELLASPYGKVALEKYMRQRFGDKKVLYSKDMDVHDDYTYVMSLEAVLHGKDRNSFYWVEEMEGSYQEGAYTIPQFKLIRKEDK